MVAHERVGEGVRRNEVCDDRPIETENIVMHSTCKHRVTLITGMLCAELSIVY